VGPAALVAGVVLVLAACTQPISQQTQSPEATPSTPAVNTTPSTAPTPADSPTPGTSPAPASSPSPAKLIITSVPFHVGEVGLTYSTVTLGAAGGVKPYKWSISSGALPPGVTVSSGGSTTGKPTTAGTYPFVIRVDDSAGSAAGVPRSIFVFRQIAFSAAVGTCTGMFNAGGGGCSTQLKYTGGASNTPKVTVFQSSQYPPLPAGSTFIAKSGIVSVTIPLSGCGTPSYNSIVTLVLVDQSPCGAGFNCSSGKLSLSVSLSNNC
jgi:hypothetical protein